MIVGGSNKGMEKKNKKIKIDFVKVEEEEEKKYNKMINRIMNKKEKKIYNITLYWGN